MKTFFILFLLICLTFFTESLKAQNLKLHAGLSFPTTSFYINEFDENDNFVVKLGFQFGPNYEFVIDETNIIKAGAILNLKGYNQSGTTTFIFNEQTNVKVDLLYLDFPLLYQRRFNIGKKSFFAEAGPYYGIGLNGKWYWSRENEEGKEEIELKLFGKDKVDLLRQTDYGVLLGFGTNYRASQFGLSFSFGLKNIAIHDHDSMRNLVFSFYINIPILTF